MMLRTIYLLAMSMVVTGSILLYSSYSSAADAPQDEVCQWANPGADKYKGDALAAMRKLGVQDPEGAAQFVATTPPTSGVVIWDDGAYQVRQGFGSIKLDRMMFGAGKVCTIAPHRKWQSTRYEIADAWLWQGGLIIKPRVCGNWATASVVETKPWSDSTGDNVPRLDERKVNTVPEPSTMWLMGIAAAGFCMTLKRKA